ncbi:MAG: enoyl-CoA hydratase-related protein, partial [Spirochaetota bacterium]
MAYEYETVLAEITDDGLIGTITLNRPEALNTFNETLARDLEQALLDLDEDKDVRVIIITGAGRSFSAGIDISPEIFEGMAPNEYYDWITLMSRPIAVMAK